MYMARFKADYDEEEDIFYLHSEKQKTKESIEVDEDIVIDIDKNNNLVGVEIFYASKLFNKLNRKITKKILSETEHIDVEIDKYRNLIIIILAFKVDNKIIKEKLPAFSTAKYESPLVASVSSWKVSASTGNSFCFLQWTQDIPL